MSESHQFQLGAEVDRATAAFKASNNVLGHFRRPNPLLRLPAVADNAARDKRHCDPKSRHLRTARQYPLNSAGLCRQWWFSFEINGGMSMVNRNRTSRFRKFTIGVRWLFAEARYFGIIIAILSCGTVFGAPEPSAPIAGTPGYVPVMDDRGVISGTVESEKGPIAGATVLIFSAKPGSPPQILEPLCYSDCLRSAVTGKAGSFSITEIDGTLRYRLLVGKESYESKYVDDVDPRSDNLRTSLRRSQFLEGKAELSGRVLDTDNRPVPAAAVIPRGYTRGNSGTEGPMEKIASVEITDSEGYFWIYTAQPVDSLTVEVRARGFASTRFENVPANHDKVQTLNLPRGVSIQGRLL